MYSLIRNGHFMASFFTFFTHINSSSLEPSQLEALWEPNCIFCWSRMVGQCHQPQSSLFQTIVIRIRQRPLLENPAKCLLLLLVASVDYFEWKRCKKYYLAIFELMLDHATIFRLDDFSKMEHAKTFEKSSKLLKNLKILAFRDLEIANICWTFFI